MVLGTASHGARSDRFPRRSRGHDLGDLHALGDPLRLRRGALDPGARDRVRHGLLPSPGALPLGGAGAADASLPFALNWTGVALAPAVLAVFAYRFFNAWLPVLPALVGLRRLDRPS
jgi:hypothetical protein